MKEIRLEQILARTDGRVFYREQIYQICSELLRLDEESSENMILAYTKKNYDEMVQWNLFIEDVIGEEELSKRLIFIFTNSIPHTHYEFLTKLKEHNYNMVIDNVLKNTDGLLRYYYQAALILTDIFGFSENQVASIINNYKHERNWKEELDYLSTKMDFLPSILNRVHGLLCKHARYLKTEVPILNF